MSLPAVSPGRTVAVALLLGALLATLAVSAPAAIAAPKNDNFARAKTLRVGQTLNGTVNAATKQSGEPRHAGSLANHTVWYRIRVRSQTAVLVSTCTASFDTILAVYTGSSVRNLREIEFNNDGCSGDGSRVTFTARRGKTYRVAVAGFVDRGTFRISAQRISVPPNDDFADGVSVGVGEGITGTTRNGTRELREPGPGAHTVWHRVRVDAASNVLLDACSNGYASISVYTGSSIDSLTGVTGGSCSITLAAQPGVTYHLQLAGNGGYRLNVSAAP
jgi:hypothetical protein